MRNVGWLAVYPLLAGLALLHADDAWADQTSSAEDHIAKLRSELAGGVVSEFTVRDVVGSSDPRVVDALSALLVRSETLRCKLRGSAAFEMAAWGLGLSGDRRAVPILREFLARQLSAKSLDPETVVCQRPRLTGARVNYERAAEAVNAALSLYMLGDWREALPVLDSFVQNSRENASAVEHLLWRTVEQLDIKKYEQDSGALDATVGYLRRACTSPFLRVRAGAALALASYDPEMAYLTAKELITIGPDGHPSSPKFLAHHKRVSLMALAAIGDARSLQLLRELAAGESALLREGAQKQLRSPKGRRPW